MPLFLCKFIFIYVIKIFFIIFFHCIVIIYVFFFCYAFLIYQMLNKFYFKLHNVYYSVIYLCFRYCINVKIKKIVYNIDFDI